MFFLNNNYKKTTVKLETMKNSKNIILFGPPGTGKTYKLKTAYFDEYITKETNLSAEENFERVVSELTWFETIALAILEKTAPISVPEVKENRWILTKAKYSETKNIITVLIANIKNTP
mgnify:CR=1 FL=1